MLRLARLPSKEEPSSLWEILLLINSIFPFGHDGAFERVCLIQSNRKKKTPIEWFARPISHKQFLSISLPTSQLHGEMSIISISPTSGETLAFHSCGGQLSLQKYMPHCNSWESVQPMLKPRHLLSFSGAVIGDFFYVAGGIRRSGHMDPMSNAERLNISTNKWEELDDMAFPNAFGKGFALHGCFYVLHSSSTDPFLLSCAEKYDPTTQKWTLITEFVPGVVKPGSFTVAVLRKELYMLDWSVQKPCGRILKFDEQTEEWSYVEQVPDHETTHFEPKQMYAVGNELWVIDGRGPLVNPDVCGDHFPNIFDHRRRSYGLHFECDQVCSETPVWAIFQGPNFWPGELGDGTNLEPKSFIHACNVYGEEPHWRTIPIFSM